MTKKCVYFIPCIRGKVYKGKTCRPLNVRQEEYGKTVVRGKVEKSGMADHILKEKGNHLLLGDEVKIIDRKERGVIVIVVENGHGDTSSNPGRDRLHFTQH